MENISDLYHSSLDNGLSVYIKEKFNVPIVTIQLWVKTGSIHEDKYLGCGLSHFLEHMMFQGTKNYPKLELSDKVSKMGGNINAYTSYGCTVYHIDLPADKLEHGIDMLSEIAMSPLFPKDAFLDEKNVILREVDMGSDSPNKFLHEKSWFEVFKVHPARFPIIGYKEQIEGVNREMMMDYYKLRYSPVRSFFIITGAVNAEKAFAQVANKFSPWKNHNLSEVYIPEEPNQICRRASQVVFNDPLARISLSYKTPNAVHKDTPVLDALTMILADKKTSRLVQELKLKQQLALNICADNYTPYFGGVTNITAISTPENSDKLADEIFNQIEKVKKGGVLQEEIDKVIAQNILIYNKSLQSNSAISGIIGDSILNSGSHLQAGEYIEIMKKITPSDISRVLDTYLNIDQSTIITMLPEKKMKYSSTKKKETESLPEIYNFSTGQKLILSKDNDSEVIDFVIIFQGGAIFENCDNAGVTKLLSLMLTTGTKSYSENEFNDLLDKNAINLSFSSGNNSFSMKMSFVKNKLNIAIDIIKTLLTEPTFNENLFQREQKNLINALKSKQQDPFFVANKKFNNLLYGKHPYSLGELGSLDSLNSLKAENLKNFFENVCLIPNATVFGISGDFDKNNITTKIENLISTVSWSNQEKFKFAEKPIFLPNKKIERISLDKEQAFVFYGMPGCSNLSEDRFAISLINLALNGMSSRIFKLIREDNGLAYYAGLSLSLGFHQGSLAFCVGTQPESGNEVLKLVKSLCDDLSKNGLTDEEIHDAKASIFFEKAKEKQYSSSLLMSSALSEYYGNGYLAPYKSLDIYQNLSKDTIQKVTKKYFSSDIKISVIAGGDYGENLS